MMIDATSVCRFCFTICDKGFNNVEDITQEIIDFLALPIDLEISSDPVVCNGCIDNLKKCFKFKAGCLYKENDIIYLGKDEDEKLNKSTNTEVNTSGRVRGDNICCFCMESIDCLPFVLATSQNKELYSALKEFFVELLSTIPENSSICMPCYQSLQRHIDFMSNCLSIEEKIKKYREAKGTNNKGKVDLISVVDFTSKSALSIKNNQKVANEESESSKEMKDEPAMAKEDSSKEPTEQELRSTKESRTGHLEIDGGNRFQSDGHLLKLEGISEKVQIDDSSVDTVKTYIANDSKSPLSLDGPVYKCEICFYNAKNSRDFSAHVCAHKSDLGVPTQISNFCTFQAKQESSFLEHIPMLKHSSIAASTEEANYTCDICSYSTPRRDKLRRHSLIHKSSAEINMFKCHLCPYENHRKDHLNKHMLVHKKDSDVRVYKCEICAQKFKRKDHLQRHMLLHKTFRCKVCGHQTKNVRAIKRHLKEHGST